MSVISLEKFGKQFEGRLPCAVSHILEEEKRGNFSFYIPAAGELDVAALVDRIEECLPHLAEVVRAPYIVLKNEYNPIRTELADNLTPQGIQMTVQDAKLWKNKDGKLRPEFIYAKSREDEYNTYENRMVRALIDKIIRFLNLPMEYSKEGVKNMYEAYFQSTSLNKFDLIKLLDDDLFRSTDACAFADYKKLFYLRGKLSQLRMSAFYKIMSQFPLFTGRPEATNLFIHNANYHACMRLWLFLDEFNAGLSLLSQDEQKSVYSAFISLAMARSYASLGYRVSADAEVKNVAENFTLQGLIMENEIFRVRLDADLNRVNVLVQCAKIRAQQATSVELHTDISEPFGKSSQFVVSLHRTDYSDRAACVVPGNKNSLKDLDSIARCTVFSFEADKAVYDKVCLICGRNALEDKDYFYRCSDCGAVYCFPDEHTVWINQFNTLGNRDGNTI